MDFKFDPPFFRFHFLPHSPHPFHHRVAVPRQDTLCPCALRRPPCVTPAPPSPTFPAGVFLPLFSPPLDPALLLLPL